MQTTKHFTPYKPSATIEYTMKRVEVAIDEPVRGIVAKYARENNTTMPSAYAELLQKGLLVSEIELSGMDLDVDEDDVDLSQFETD